MISKEEKIYQLFKLPIEYNSQKISIQNNISQDLELSNTIDSSSDPIYSYIFKPKTELGKLSINSWNKYYTNDINFLTESQQLYSNFTTNIDTTIINTMINNWNKIKEHTNFLEKYQFIEWQPFLWLNNYTAFLTLLSYYSISAPLFNLAFPIIALILPFLILKLTKIPITFENYKKIIIQQLQNHIIGKFWNNFKNVSWNQRLYYSLSFSLYLYSIYQNILYCYKFYKNSKEITQCFSETSHYIDYTIDKMNIYIQKTKKLSKYYKFNQNLIQHRKILTQFNNKIKDLPQENISIKKITLIGYILKQFYSIYSDQQLENSILFSLGFHGYIDTILGIHQNINNNYIHPTQFIQSKHPVVDMKNMYYPALIDSSAVKNSINLKYNKIITGPNAAGKTTTIKSTILNILFSQQIGFGFFSECTITPFDFIHTYINIPDTIARDSLFQAEARRCKEILQIIKNNKNKKHFCIFDELYSGTNPYEAISSAYSYLKYINKYSNVRFLLTTHYIKLCNLFEKGKKNKIKNYHMETLMIKNKPVYTYKLKNGISSIKGGVCILKQLKYPKKIVKYTEKILRTL